MVLKQVQGDGISQDWAVYDDNGNELNRGTFADMQAYYDVNKDITIKDAYVVGEEIVDRERNKEGDIVQAMATFHVQSSDTLVVGDTTSSSIMTGMATLATLRGFELDAPTQAMKNISGRELVMSGNLSIQISHSGAQPVDFFVFSESSEDGIVWNFNDGSLRKNTIVKDGIDYRTIASFTDVPIPDGSYVRFRFARSGAGSATLETPTETIDGNLIAGHSFNWFMFERQ